MLLPRPGVRGVFRSLPRMRVTEELTAPVNGIEIAYQEIGDPEGEPIVLIMGLGTQMIAWDLEFCGLLADEGFRVIRFDNRDVGRSTSLGRRPPNPAAMLLGLPFGLAYTLDDMADDAAGLIEHLELEPTHVVGISQGGMIAQVLAYKHPQKVRSLGLLSTGAGKRIASLPRLRALGILLAKPPRGREAFVEQVARTFRVIGSPDYPPDPERLRAVIGESYDRGHNPAGAARQLHAVTAAPERTRRLRTVRVPTVVIHGTADPLVRPVAGRQVAKAIPGARLELIEGMGHDLPRELWPRITGLLIDNARRAAAREPAAA
jgi:pimeloyl-ACP methyl ester carboxylesterase